MTVRIGGRAIIARLPGDASLSPGEPITLGLGPARAYLFDASGRRL